MKTIEKPNGQIFEVYETQAEIVEMVLQNYITNKEWISEDDTLYIEYKDGSSYYLTKGLETGKFKRQGIKTVIEDNGTTKALFGQVEIVYNEHYEDWDVKEI